MVERQLPKLHTRVRFPSPAPVLTRLASMALCALLGLSQAATAQPTDGKPVVAVLQPSPVPFSEPLLRSLKLPAGFEMSVFAKNLGNVRWMQVAANGDVYASLRAQGEVMLLRDTDGDGVADMHRTVARIARVHGLLLHGGKLYMASDRALDVADVQSDGTLSAPRRLLSDLPEGGNHPRRTLGMGPDGWLYLSVGSTCNNCAEANPESATLLRLRPDDNQREVFARGLRNTMGFGWHPVTGQLYGFDHGSDMRGDDQPPEELNAILKGKHYGWPWCLGARVPDPVQTQNPPGTRKQTFCPTTPRRLPRPPPPIRPRLALSSTPAPSFPRNTGATALLPCAARGTAPSPAATACRGCALAPMASLWAWKTSSQAGCSTPSRLRNSAASPASPWRRTVRC